jgi:hypothetical protein
VGNRAGCKLFLSKLKPSGANKSQRILRLSKNHSFYHFEVILRGCFIFDKIMGRATPPSEFGEGGISEHPLLPSLELLRYFESRRIRWDLLAPEGFNFERNNLQPVWFLCRP